MRKIELIAHEQEQKKNMKSSIDHYLVHRTREATRDKARPATNHKSRMGNVQLVRHGRDLRDFYGFGVSIPVTSKGVPKLLEKISTRYDYSSAQRGIKSIAQQEIELRLKHGQPKLDPDKINEISEHNPKFVK